MKLINITSISDTHGQEPKLKGGDILIHCGDLTKHGSRVEVEYQLNYLESLKSIYKHVLLTPGNHDFWCEDETLEFKKICKDKGLICLMDESINIMGLNIYGSPHTPVFHDWAFNRNPEQLLKLYSKIPKGLDILFTHGPPHLVLDKTFFGQNVGCPILKLKVESLKPKVHLFGHIHECGGLTYSSQDTEYINCALSGLDFVMEVE